MSLSRFGAMAGLILGQIVVWQVVVGQGAHAQSSGLELPAEFPPASYTANQYVDSTGCTFIRAGLSGAVTWVPRVNRDRSPLCGFQPSLAGGTDIAANAAAIANAPVIDIPASAPQVGPQVGPQVAQVAAAAAPGNGPGLPMDTVATLTTPPPRLPAAVQSPRIIDLPLATTVQPPAAMVPAPPAALTRDQICSGRTGVQPGYVSSLTGQPLDCGGVTISAAVADIAPLPRMTMAQICTSMDATGQRYMHAATGIEVRCGPQTQPIHAGGMAYGGNIGIGGPAGPRPPLSPGLPPRPSIAPLAVSMDAPPAPPAPPVVSLGGQQISLAALCQISDATGTRYINAATGIPVRCGPQVQSPSGVTSPFGGVSVARNAPVPALAPLPVPPAVTRAAPIAPPPGYRAVWDDGRLNPHRGLPEGNAQALVQTAPALTISAMNLPPAVNSGHRFVQVGSFADPANAERTAARLQAMGLPVGFAAITSDGTVLRIVAAGPFNDAASLGAALQAARAAGFSDAFTRG